MFSRLKNSLLFRLEQAMVRGPAARLAFILSLVVLVAIVGVVVLVVIFAVVGQHCR